MNIGKSVRVFAAMASMALPAMATAHDDYWPNNYVSVSGGLLNVTDQNYSDYRHNRYYDGYQYSQHDNALGASLGASARFELAPRIIVDADYSYDQARIESSDLRRQQFEVGAGYLGSIGRGLSWYVEGVYAHVNFDGNNLLICGGACQNGERNGGGIKSGFIWPFASQWYATVGFGYLGFATKDNQDGLNEALLNGTIGYRFNPNMSVGLRLDYSGYINRNDTRYQQDFSSWRAFVSYHF